MLSKLISILKMIRVIRFELVMHVYKEAEADSLAPLGTLERVEQTSTKQIEYRRLHKAATTAYEEHVDMAASVHAQQQPHITAERLAEKEFDDKWH